LERIAAKYFAQWQSFVSSSLTHKTYARRSTPWASCFSRDAAVSYRLPQLDETVFTALPGDTPVRITVRY